MKIKKKNLFKIMSTGCCGKSVPANHEDIKDAVRKAYANVAVKNSCGEDVGNPISCCGAPKETDVNYSKLLGYSEEEISSVLDGANMGLGCGNPTAIASLKLGETVVDLGSGGGFDCFLAARKVGPTGDDHSMKLKNRHRLCYLNCVAIGNEPFSRPSNWCGHDPGNDNQIKKKC